MLLAFCRQKKFSLFAARCLLFGGIFSIENFLIFFVRRRCDSLVISAAGHVAGEICISGCSVNCPYQESQIIINLSGISYTADERDRPKCTVFGDGNKKWNGTEVPVLTKDRSGSHVLPWINSLIS